MKNAPKVTPAVFIGTLLCFLLPFVTISCGGQKAATLSGTQMALGTTLEQPQMFGPPQKQKIDPDPYVALAGVCVIVGLVLSFLGPRIAVGSAIAAGVGAISLLGMKYHLDNEIVTQGRGMMQAAYEPGYWLTLFLMVASAAWSAYVFSQAVRILAPASAGPPPAPGLMNSPPLASPGSPGAAPGMVTPRPPGQPANPARFCSSCGQALTAPARFCPGCGSSLG